MVRRANWNLAKQNLLVMLGSCFEFTEEYVRVAQVAMSSPFSGFVAKLAGNVQSLLVIADGLSKVTQQVVGIAQIAACSSLGRSVR